MTALRAPDAVTREAAAWSMTQLGAAAAPATSALGQGLEDDDPVVRGLVATALSNLTALSDDVAGLLGKHLKDPDENVRMVVNNALATHGAAAKRLLPQLIAAARVPGEHRHVLRSIAMALGSIGPEARPALPVLRELEKMPLVRWQAQWAIRRIQGP
jgi:HEAT repeat protein